MLIRKKTESARHPGEPGRPKCLFLPLEVGQWFAPRRYRRSLDQVKEDLAEDFDDMLAAGHRRITAVSVIWFRSLAEIMPFVWDAATKIFRRSELRFAAEAELILEVETLPPIWMAGRQCATRSKELSTKLELIENKHDRCMAAAKVAAVLYLTGDLGGAERLARKYMRDALDCAILGDVDPMWGLSYPIINTRLFLGDFEGALALMEEHWAEHYIPLSDEERSALFERLKGSTVNPLASIPRHRILAWFFAGKLELGAFESSFAEALQVCREGGISLDFSYAYAAGYLTLVLDASPPLEANPTILANRIEDLLNHVTPKSARVSRYVREGFCGIYRMVRGEMLPATVCLGRARELAERTDNRFLCPLFSSCHAVALAHQGQHRVASRVLKQALLAAESTGLHFHRALAEQAAGTVALLRGRPERASAHYVLAEELGLGAHLRRLLRARR